MGLKEMKFYLDIIQILIHMFLSKKRNVLPFFTSDELVLSQMFWFQYFRFPIEVTRLVGTSFRLATQELFLRFLSAYSIFLLW